MEALETLLEGRTTEDIANIRKILTYNESLARRANPLKYYEPNGAIEKFITAAGRDEKKWIFILAAANKVGKTAGAINVLGNIIWGPQTEWFKQSRFIEWPYKAKKFWYLSEHTTLKKFICGIDEQSSEIRKWFPRKKFSFTKAGQEYFSHLVTDNGWSGDFMSYDMDPRQFESDNISLVVMDEPPPEVIFNAAIARMLYSGGIIIMPMTPLTNSAWVKDRLVDGNSSDDTFVLYADIHENCIQCGVRGTINHSQIEAIIDKYSDEEKEARAFGRWGHMSGVVFKTIDRELHKHKRPPEDFNDVDNQIFLICDPHDARPPFLLWAAVDQFKQPWLIDEWPPGKFHELRGTRYTTEDVADVIIERETSNGWNPQKIIRVMDPNFGRKPMLAVGKTVEEHFFDVGLAKGYPLHFTTDVVDDLYAGHQALRDYFKLVDGEARFHINAERCPNTWYAFFHYSYSERRGRRLDVDGPGDKVAEKYKDPIDTARYFAMYLRGPEKPIRVLTAEEKHRIMLGEIENPNFEGQPWRQYMPSGDYRKDF